MYPQASELAKKLCSTSFGKNLPTEMEAGWQQAGKFRCLYQVCQDLY